MGSKVDLSGLKAVQSRLMALPAEVQTSIATGALRAGANLVAEQVRANAPVSRPSTRNRKVYGITAGALRASVRVTQGVITEGGVARVSVLVGSHRKKDSLVFYAKMVEYGTAPHWISVREDARPKRNTRRGVRPVSMRTLNRMAARGSLKIGENFVGASVHHPGARRKPFMRPAFDAKSDEAAQVILAYLQKKIDRHMRGVKEAA